MNSPWKKITIFLCLLLMVGCQTIKYRAEPTPLVTFDKLQQQEENFYYSENVHFFLWGFTPNPAEVNITRIAMENGAPGGLTNVRIHEELTLWTWLVGFLTAGIYVPRYTEIHGVKVPGGTGMYYRR